MDGQHECQKQDWRSCGRRGSGAWPGCFDIGQISPCIEIRGSGHYQSYAGHLSPLLEGEGNERDDACRKPPAMHALARLLLRLALPVTVASVCAVPRAVSERRPWPAPSA